VEESSDRVRTAADDDGAAFGLSRAELRVLGYLPTHLQLAAVADRLHLSRDTVKTHVRSIYRKLDVRDCDAAVAVAVAAGLVDDVIPPSASSGPAAPHRTP
jgi:LuxR family maltose regulon positive regulatory protein